MSQQHQAGEMTHTLVRAQKDTQRARRQRRANGVSVTEENLYPRPDGQNGSFSLLLGITYTASAHSALSDGWMSL